MCSGRVSASSGHHSRDPRSRPKSNPRRRRRPRHRSRSPRSGSPHLPPLYFYPPFPLAPSPPTCAARWTAPSEPSPAYASPPARDTPSTHRPSLRSARNPRSREVKPSRSRRYSCSPFAAAARFQTPAPTTELPPPRFSASPRASERTLRARWCTRTWPRAWPSWATGTHRTAARRTGPGKIYPLENATSGRTIYRWVSRAHRRP